MILFTFRKYLQDLKSLSLTRSCIKTQHNVGVFSQLKQHGCQLHFPGSMCTFNKKTVVPLWGSSKLPLQHQARFSDRSHVKDDCREDSPWFLGGGTAGLVRSECRGSSHSWERALCWYRAQCRGPPCSCGWCPGISFYPETETKTKTIMKVQGTAI